LFGDVSHMKKPTIVIIAACCLMAILGLCMFGAFKGGASDAERHQAWGRTGRVCGVLRSMNRRLPAGFVKLSHLSQLEEKYSKKWATQREALVASGYFTNAVIVIPRAEEPPDTAPYYQHRKAVIRQTADRVWKALQGRGEFQCSYPSNGVVVITCRPQDVPLCAEALRE
jgi:hypothetical protein